MAYIIKGEERMLPCSNKTLYSGLCQSCTITTPDLFSNLFLIKKTRFFYNLQFITDYYEMKYFITLA